MSAKGLNPESPSCLWHASQLLGCPHRAGPPGTQGSEAPTSWAGRTIPGDVACKALCPVPGTWSALSNGALVSTGIQSGPRKTWWRGREGLCRGKTSTGKDKRAGQCVACLDSSLGSCSAGTRQWGTRLHGIAGPWSPCQLVWVSPGATAKTGKQRRGVARCGRCRG